jgi:hypothetical protein
MRRIRVIEVCTSFRIAMEALLINPCRKHNY